MFERIQNNPALNNGPVTFTILQQMEKARETSHHHHIVERAYSDLKENRDYSLDRFGRDALRSVWRSNLSFTTKYLATLWWGNTGRNFTRVFTPENMEKLNGFAHDLENDLRAATKAKDLNGFWNLLNELFNKLDQQNGEYKLSRISYAFFTKMLQFFFASHPIAARNEFGSRPYLPVISDQWIMKAVYVDMARELRGKTFSANAKTISLKNTPDSYRVFVDYFNSRSNHLGRNAWELEELLFRNPQVTEEWNRLFNAPSSTKEKEKKTKAKKQDKEKILRIGGRKVLVDYHMDLTIDGNPNYILYVGKDGVISKRPNLPYYCELYLKGKDADIKNLFKTALFKDLLSVLSYIPTRATNYICSTNETTCEEAKAVYEKAKAILIKHGQTGVK